MDHTMRLCNSRNLLKDRKIRSFFELYFNSDFPVSNIENVFLYAGLEDWHFWSLNAESPEGNYFPEANMQNSRPFWFTKTIRGTRQNDRIFKNKGFSII
jgi:hypothetical protein